MYKNNFVESQSFFNKYMQQAMKNKKKANNEDAAGVRCQRCLKYGHLTYECKNENVYLYRPSRTMQFKEKQLQYELNNEKPPEVPDAFDGDWRRNTKKKVALDVSSDSDSEEQVEGKKEGIINNVKKQKSSSSESSSEDSSSSDSDSDSSGSSQKRRKSRSKEKKQKK
ncbi:unnamed protein product [Paramecium sonneborni]|uniref:Uncharacterized protein n=1 Tax=Paramecium sonneborni TaxID=65129 RepID=A0A8S1NVX8_9CILI|nr:unnamed protein product [Paramecium sonneborni]CAD8096476.1 unnamed protein product [Paramecium sonneborni]